MNPSLLIELGTEELPPKALKNLSTAFSTTLTESLRAAELLSENTQIKAYASPRRLAVWISDVAHTQKDYSQIRKGPAITAAFDNNGEPTRAAEGFAKSCGVEVADLDRDKTDQGEWLTFEQTIVGKPIRQCAQEALDAAIAELPVPKRMRWGSKSVEFVRPAHWLIALHGESILELHALDLNASNTSRGHRFHHRDIIVINHADEYSEELRRCYVLADYSLRQARIKKQCEALASDAGGTAVLDPALLDEVTGLVEWPVSLLGNFDADFLDVPREALIASMKDHQKYFHLTNTEGELLPMFITVSNIESTAPVKVVTGNERVLQARLSDGRFFWEQDKLRSLEDNAERLDDLLFHIKLGSMADKTRRLKSISGKLAELIGADTASTQRAADLCKLDLLSLMVGEFASLQGIMGRYYALHDGENELVAEAIEQHYWPKFSGDKLPKSSEAVALALADRLDALVGIFATGEIPSGMKDPYALRRAALGVLRILIEKQLDLPLQDLLDITADAYQDTGLSNSLNDQGKPLAVKKFILDRLRAYYTQAFDANTFNAVAAVAPTRIYDFDRRIRAVSAFFDTEKSAATALAAANKRIANILKKQSTISSQYDSSLFSEDAERELASVLESLQKSACAAFENQRYADGLSDLARLQEPVDKFFDSVRVMDDDINVRNNRLGLLGALRDLFLQVADISHLNIDKDA